MVHISRRVSIMLFDVIVKALVTFATLPGLLCVHHNYKGTPDQIYDLQKLSVHDDFAISSESSDSSISDHMIFRYDGPDNSWLMIAKLWSSVTVTIQSVDRGFKTEVSDSMQALRHNVPSGDLSHDLATGFEHFQDACRQLLHALHHILLFHIFSVADDEYISSVSINPISDQQFVKVCYHGSSPTAVFTVTLEETVIHPMFPVLFTFGVLLILFADKLSRYSHTLSVAVIIIVGIVLIPYTSVYTLSRVIPSCRKLKLLANTIFLVDGILVTMVISYLVFAEHDLLDLALSSKPIIAIPILVILVLNIAILSSPPTISMYHTFQGYLKHVPPLWLHYCALWLYYCGSSLPIIWSTHSWIASCLLLSLAVMIKIWFRKIVWMIRTLFKKSVSFIVWRQ